MRNNNHLYLGRAGQLFVVTEFLKRHWNAAIPEVDTGDDVFVVRDKIGEFKRIQVKTITGDERKSYGYSAKFTLPYNQVRTPVQPELVYFLVVSFEGNWKNYLIIERGKLDEYIDLNKDKNKIGTINAKKDTIQLHFSFNIKNNSVLCSKLDFKSHVKDWTIFPVS